MSRKEEAMKRTNRSMKVFSVVVVIFAWMLSAGGVIAQEKPIELTYATQYASTHPFSLADLRWIDRMEKETKGRVKIKPYWAGTLVSGRESMHELSKGVADIAFITPIYEKSGVELTRALVDFYRGSSPEVNVKIYWEIYNKFPEFRKEYENVKLIAAHAGTPMRLMTTKKPIKTVADLKGMRIRATGDVISKTLKDLGTEPVVMPVSEMYESLQKGIIQGVIFAEGDYKSLKLSEIIKFETENFLQDRGPYGSRAMNLNTWKRLPPDVQKVVEGSSEWWSQESLNESKKPDEEGKAMAVKAGVQFVQMDPAGIQKYHAILDEEILNKAKALDAKGLPGTKLYEEIRRLVKQYNPTK